MWIRLTENPSSQTYRLRYSNAIRNSVKWLLIFPTHRFASALAPSIPYLLPRNAGYVALSLLLSVSTFSAMKILFATLTILQFFS